MLQRVLQSIDSLDYPKDRLTLLMIDNYSRDGAFEFVKRWLEERRRLYMGIIHVRARGPVPRLRNIAILIALSWGFRYLSFIESDVVVDEEFLNRLLSVMEEHSAEGKKVFSVSAVRDEGLENLDWLERLRVRWLKSRRERIRGVATGEACNTGNCLIDLERVREVGFIDEDVLFIEDLDWGRRATRKGLLCLFDGRVAVTHLKKYTLREEFRKYFFRGALSEAKLFLKNGLTRRALRSALYWDAVFSSALLAFITPIPLALTIAVGYAAYFRRSVGLGRLLLYPVTAPFSIAKSLALTAAILYWTLRGGYKSEKVTVLGEPDWEVVDKMLGSQ